LCGSAFNKVLCSVVIVSGLLTNREPSRWFSIKSSGICIPA